MFSNAAAPVLAGHRSRGSLVVAASTPGPWVEHCSTPPLTGGTRVRLVAVTIPLVGLVRTGLRQSRARSAARATPAADASAPAACLSSDRAAGGRRGLLG